MPPQFTTVMPIALIVDDEDTLRQATARALSRFGYEVRTASNGREAVEAMRAAPLPHVVLMDLMMPEMSGADAARALRSDPRTAGVPIIAWSGGTRCIPTPLGDFEAVLSKPVDLRALLEVLDGVSGGRSTS